MKKLPPRFEFLIVILIAFGLPSFNALSYLISGSHEVLFTEANLKFLLIDESVVLLALSWFLKKRGWTFTKLGLLLPSWESTVLGVALILALDIINALILIALALLIPEFQLTIPNKIPVAPGISLWIITFASVLNPLFEELFICGYVISFLRRYKSIWFAVIISTAIRVLSHLYQPLRGVIFILCLGLIFGYCYARTNQLWSVIVAHAFFDFWGLLILSSGG